MKTFSQQEAQAAGYKSVTSTYTADEQILLERAIIQFRGTNYCVVRIGDGHEVWRHKSQLRDPDQVISAAATKHPRHHGKQ